MSETAEGLKQLHRLLSEKQEIEQQVAAGPKKIKAQDKVIATQEDAVQQRQAAVLQLKKTYSEKSLQLKTLEDKLVTLKTRLNAADNNRDYEILKTQLAADTMAKSVMEDEILDTLERTDSANEEVRKAEEQRQAAREKKQQLEQKVAEELPKLQEQIARLNAQIAAAEQVIPASNRIDYQRLVATYGPDSLAAVRGGACTCCFVKPVPQYLVDLKQGKLLFCRSCGRINYLDRE